MGTKADPKVMIGEFNRLRQANGDVDSGRFDEAAAVARDVLTHDRGNAFATVILAGAEMGQGRNREAIAHYREYLGLAPTSADAHHWIAICYAREGDSDRAIAEEDVALSMDPHFGDAHDLRGGLLAARGRTDDAVRELRAAVESDPDRSAFRVGLGRILVDAGFDEAEVEVRRALGPRCGKAVSRERLLGMGAA